MKSGSTVSNERRRAFGTRVQGLAGTLLMVAASTIVGLLIEPRWGNAPIVLLYLPPVLGAAILYGLWSAMIAAIVSTLAYDFFFTEPYHRFVIASPGDVVTVLVLFLVALVTSQLAGSMRDQARLAETHAARNATIAGLARRLLSSASEDDIAGVAVQELARLFGCHAVLLVDRAGPQPVASAPLSVELNPGDIAAAAMTLATGDSAGRGIRRLNLTDWQFHPVLSAQGTVAAVGLARADGMQPLGEDQLPLLGNLLDQVALALERSRLEHEAREFATSRERDRLRSALLASIGEDVKPRLNAISAAARALRRSGSADKALATTVSAEASKLDRYIDSLVELAPGSDRKPIEAGAVTIDLYRRSVRKGHEEVHLTPKEYAVMAELAKHAGRVLTHAHLLRAVWGPAHEQHIDYLRVAVRSLRQKLEQDPAHPQLILNEPAIGYRLMIP